MRIRTATALITLPVALLGVLPVGLLGVLLGILAPGTARADVRHVIIMIADGWGQSQLDAAAYWHGARAIYENDPAWLKVGMTTYMHHEGGEPFPYGEPGFVGIHGYDPEQAWADWNYQQTFVTDSAAAATAMSTGEKTYAGAIGMGIGDGTPGGRVPLAHAFERAEVLGFATGVVTSVPWTHATPAGFRAHAIWRENYAAIGQQLIHASGLDVIMGAGHPDYDDDGQWVPGDPAVPGDWKYVGGRDTWLDLAAGAAGGDEPWTLIDAAVDFVALAAGDLVLDRVVGTARVAETLQYNRAGRPEGQDPEPPYTAPFLAGVPTLATMTRGALAVLERHEAGFLLLVEGGAVDWAGHERVLGRLIEELDDFNAAVTVVRDWVATHSSWDETCLMITGDHETGFLWGPGVVPGEPSTWFAPVADHGAGVMPGFSFYATPDSSEAEHTNQIIPFFARGAGCEHLSGLADESDPYLPAHRPTNPGLGTYLDNTEVADAILALLPATVAVNEDGGPLGEMPPGPLLRGCYPNPFNPRTTLTLTLPRSETVALRIHDPRGRRIRTLVNAEFAAGDHEVIWDGCDDTGRPVPGGVYFARLVGAAGISVGRMCLVR